MNRILTALSQIENTVVRRAFSSQDFSITDKTPILTVGVKNKKGEKTPIDEGSLVREADFYIGVFTHKDFGAAECEQKASEVVSVLKPLFTAFEVSRPVYVAALKRFRSEVSVTLPREIF